MKTLNEVLAEAERAYWVALLETQLSMNQIAEISGRSRPSIYHRLQALGIKPTRRPNKRGNASWQALATCESVKTKFQYRATRRLNEQRTIQHGPGVAAGKGI